MMIQGRVVFNATFNNISAIYLSGELYIQMYTVWIQAI